MQNHEEPDAEPGAACRTPFCRLFLVTSDLGVNWLALKVQTDGFLWAYAVVQGTPSVCGAVPGSRS